MTETISFLRLPLLRQNEVRAMDVCFIRGKMLFISDE